MESYRIAIVVDHYLPRLGGVELQVADLARQLAAHGHCVTVITTTPGATDGDDFEIVRLPGPLLPRFQIACTPQSLRELQRFLRDGSYDVVHVHASVVSPLAYAACLFAKQLSLPVVLTIHSIWRRMSALASWAERRWLRDADMTWTTVSHYNADGIARRASRPVALLPNGIDSDWWRIEPRSHDGLQVTSVLRLNSKKRPEAFIRAVPNVLRAVRNPKDVRFTLVGDGPRRAAMERLVRRLDLASCVSLPGRLTREEIRELFRVTDVFAHPTRLEAFGISILEAACAGLPLVAMADSGTTDLVTEQTGIQAADDVAFAAGIARMLDDPLRRRRCGTAARELSVAYDWSRVVPMHLEAYGRVVRRHKLQPLLAHV